MTEEEKLGKVLDALTKNGVQIGNFVMDNHGTMTLNSGCGTSEQHKPKQEEHRRAVAPRPLSAQRRQLLQQIMDLIALGDWQLQGGVERIGRMMCRVLGADGVAMNEKERQMSEQLWTLFEHRRNGEALRVTFLNMIGYWDERGLLYDHGGSPSLCKMFFKTDAGYCNIDKGRPGRSGMQKDFEDVLPLLDQYCPQQE